MTEVGLTKTKMLSETLISKSIFASVGPLWRGLVTLLGDFWNILWSKYRVGRAAARRLRPSFLAYSIMYYSGVGLRRIVQHITSMQRTLLKIIRKIFI